MPYEFDTVDEAYQHIYERCVWNGILQVKSLGLISSKRGHLELRCPIIGDYIDVVGDPQAISELVEKLQASNLFR